MTIIQAKAIISGEDRTGATLAAIAKKLAGLGKGAKASAELVKVEKTLASVGSAKLPGLPKIKRDLEAVNREVKRLSEATAAPTTRLALSTGLKRDIADLKLGRGAVRSLASDYARMRSEQERTVAGIGNAKVRAQVLAADTANVEGRLLSRARKMRQERDIAAELTAPAPNSRARRQIESGARFVAGAAGVAGGGYVAQRAVRGAVGEAAGTVREDIRSKNAGITPEENRALRERAAGLSLEFPSLSALSGREIGRLLIPNVGDAAKAMELLPEYVRGHVALQSIVGPKDAGREMETYAKFIDIIGRSRNVDDTKQLIDGYIRGRQLDSGAFNSEDFLNAAKFAAAPGKGLNLGFWRSVFPALAMQQGGARTGTDFASAYQNTVMGRTPEATMMNQIDAGIRVGAKVKTKKNGKRVPEWNGELVDKQLFTEDPYAWGKKHLIPHLVKQGALPKSYLTGNYTEDLTPEQRTKTMEKTSALFSNRRGANLFSMFLSDLEQFESVMKRLEKTRGTADVAADQQKDPYVAAEGVVQQLRNFGAVLTEPALQQAGPVLHNLATGIGALSQQLSKSVKDNPEIAANVSAKTAAVGVPATAWFGGWLAKTVAGAGDGVLSNALRLGGGALQAGGRFLTKGGVLGTLFSSTLDATIEADRQFGHRKASGPGSKSYGRALRRQLDERDAGQKAEAERDPRAKQRDGVQREIENARTFGARMASNWGTTSAVGQAMAAKVDAKVRELESRRDALDEQIRESRRGKVGFRGDRPGRTAAGADAPQAAPAAEPQPSSPPPTPPRRPASLSSRVPPSPLARPTTAPEPALAPPSPPARPAAPALPPALGPFDFSNAKFPELKVSELKLPEFKFPDLSGLTAKVMPDQITARVTEPVRSDVHVKQEVALLPSFITVKYDGPITGPAQVPVVGKAGGQQVNTGTSMANRANGAGE